LLITLHALDHVDPSDGSESSIYWSCVVFWKKKKKLAL